MYDPNVSYVYLLNSLASVNKPQVIASAEVTNPELLSPISPKPSSFVNDHYRLLLADLIQFENEILTGGYIRNMNGVTSATDNVQAICIMLED